MVGLVQGELGAGPGLLGHPLPLPRGELGLERGQRNQSNMPRSQGVASVTRAGTLTILPHPPLQPHPSVSVSHPHPVPKYIQMYRGALPGFHLPCLSLPPSPPQGPLVWSSVLPGHPPGIRECGQEGPLCKAAEPGSGRAGPQSWPLSEHHPYPEPWAAPGLLSWEQEMCRAWLGSQTHGYFLPHTAPS